MPVIVTKTFFIRRLFSSLFFLFLIGCVSGHAQLSDTLQRDSATHPTIDYRPEYDFIFSDNIQAGTDKDGSWLLSRLNGVIVLNHPRLPFLQELNCFAIG